MVPEDTVPTNIYMSSYLSHHTVQYGAFTRQSAEQLHGYKQLVE